MIAGARGVFDPFWGASRLVGAGCVDLGGFVLGVACLRRWRWVFWFARPPAHRFVEGPLTSRALARGGPPTPLGDLGPDGRGSEISGSETESGVFEGCRTRRSRWTRCSRS